MPSSLEQRLRELEHDELVHIIVGLAASNKKLAKVIAAETMSTPERIASVKRGITSLRKLQDRRTRVHAYDVADKIKDVVRQITNISRQDLGAAFELVCKLIESEATILYGFDDSSGMAMAVFRTHVEQIFTALVQRLSDPKILLKGLRTICENDEFGTVGMLLRESAEYLPDDVADALAKHLRARTAARGPNNHGSWDSNLSLLKSVHAGRGDVESYVALMAESTEEQQDDVVTVAELYLEHDDLASADVWLSKIQPDTFRHEERARRLRHTWLQRTTDAEAHERHARNCVTDNMSPTTISFFRSHYGDELLASVMSACAAKYAATLTTMEPEVAACTSLVTMGHGEAVASFVEQHTPPPSGPFRQWLAFIDELAAHGFPRAATVLSRTSLEFATHRADPGYYGFAANLYWRLYEQSPLIKDWGKLQSHEEYIAAFLQKHRLKHQLWEWIEGLRPPGF